MAEKPGQRDARKGEELESVPVVLWSDPVTTAEWCAVDVRTVASWRKMGLPSVREADGTRWFAWPHTMAWAICLLDWRQGSKRRVDRVPFACAWARLQYTNACAEAGVGYPVRVLDAADADPGTESSR